MSDAISVLVVDDDEESRELLTPILEAMGFRVDAVSGGREALRRLTSNTPGGTPDVVILDVAMPDIDGLETLKRYRAAGGRQPVIMLSGMTEASTAMQAMRLGASEYVTKPINPEEVREILERVVGDAGQTQQVTVPRAATPGAPIALSPAMRRVSELIGRIADVDVPILITGESGVGKDVASRDIHARSTRRDKVFVKINCAALPGELLESELFGHERGSFTGAARTKQGQFEIADGGTLFLDEIGEMPVTLQAKLLQALQDGEFYHVGGSRKIKVDVRVIVATNVNLEKAIAEGKFREDLYYRLNVVHFEIPPLRERREDIPGLIELFAEKYGKRYGRPVEMPPVVMARFLSYDWPGNIRELENLVRRLTVLRDPSYVLAEMRDRGTAGSGLVNAAAPPPTGMHGSGIGGGMTFAQPQQAVVAPQPPMQAVPQPHPLYGNFPPPPAMLQNPPTIPQVVPQTTVTYVDGELRIDLKEVGRQAAHIAEREAIVTMLGHTGGNKREAAERLGISYKAILYKIREFGIGRPRSPRRLPRPQDQLQVIDGGQQGIRGSVPLAAEGAVALGEDSDLEGADDLGMDDIDEREMGAGASAGEI